MKKTKKYSDFDKMEYLFKINKIAYRPSKIWGDDNRCAGRAIWLSTGHFEFDPEGNLVNVVDY